LETEWSRETARGSHAVMMPADEPTASRATKEGIDEGRNIEAFGGISPPGHGR
jgi:hypothetical protein